jgi:predicted nucleotidyltransferase
MNPQRLEQLLTKLRISLRELYGEELIDVILFGSQARKTANLDSDIDILLVLKNDFNLDAEIERTSYLIADLCLEYDILINRLFMSQNYYQHHQSALLRNIHQEGIRV